MFRVNLVIGPWFKWPNWVSAKAAKLSTLLRLLGLATRKCMRMSDRLRCACGQRKLCRTNSIVSRVQFSQEDYGETSGRLWGDYRKTMGRQ